VVAVRRGFGVMKRVFISFIIEDENAVKGLRLLAKNPGYSDLEFYDESVRVPINSVDAPYIKRRIREKIRRCGVILCLISDTTHTSSWVTWELETAIEMEKPIVAMAVKSVDRATLPAPIRNKGVRFYPWDPSGVRAYLDDAVLVR
jgi:MTH538 TIR-like domain (DUF1863)